MEGLRPGQSEVTIVLPRAGAIAGRVLDPDGEPVGAGVPVRAVAEGPVDRSRPGTGMTAYTGSDGRFRIEGLLDHPFRVSAGGGDSGFAPGATRSGVRTGTSELELRVSVGVEISGRLQDASGRPFRTHLLSARAVADQTAAPSHTTVIDEMGRFTIRGLPPGEVSFSCFRGSAFVSLGIYTAPAKDLVVTVPD